MRRRCRRLLVAATVLVAASAVALAVWSASRDGGSHPEPPRSDQVPQLAWFYKPPTDGTRPSELVRRSAEIVLTKNDESFLRLIREEGWAYAVPLYVGLPWVRGPAGHHRPGGECRSPRLIAGNSFAWFRQDFCERLHPHEGVFLHRADGERLYRDPGDGFGWLYAVDPADPIWRTFVSERVEQTFAGRGGVGPFGYGGLFLDEAWATRAHLLQTYANADGTLREYGSEEGWQAATRSLIDHVRELVDRHGHRTWINTDHDATVYDDVADGLMVENFAASWQGELLAADEQVELWERIEANASAGRQVLLVGQGTRPDRTRMLYAYASYLLVAAPEVLFRYSSDPLGYRELWRYPEYDLRLGSPTGLKRRVAQAVWRRDFDNGTAVVNLGGEPARVVLGSTYRTPEGDDVADLELPARSAIVLTSRS